MSDAAPSPDEPFTLPLPPGLHPPGSDVVFFAQRDRVDGDGRVSVPADADGARAGPHRPCQSRGVVARLTRTHEVGTGDAKPWKMTDSSPEYIDMMLKNIVGIEIEVERMVAKFKLSQEFRN